MEVEPVPERRHHAAIGEDVLHHGNLLHCTSAGNSVVISKLINTNNLAQDSRKSVKEGLAQVLDEK